jgi:5'(3')-deoxyribonucleotidase
MVPYDNVIITDLDGCVVYYEHSFHMWMVDKGYKDVVPGTYYMDEKYGISKDEAEHLVRAFNESAMLKRLPPVKDAIKYIRKLHEEYGYVFHAITAVPNTPAVLDARLTNLDNLFGTTVFERIVLCEHSADKPKYLKEYEGTECYWIEDIGKQAVMGLDFGLKPLLMDRHYNREFWCPENVRRVYDWKEIYQIVTGENI